MLEDDQDDQHLTKQVMGELSIDMPVEFISSSDDVIPMLEQATPLLVLLDYNTYPETGLDVVKRVRAHADFRHLPIVLLGEFNDPDFVKSCYECGVNSYIVKPNTLEETRSKIKSFFHYWMDVAETPLPLSVQAGEPIL